MEGAQGGGTDDLPKAAMPTAKGQDRCKRDEWSDGGILSLLEIYEAKWLLRNRAKLKGSDWEDIARQVSVRSSGTKALKAPNQCKNKIESMKKRYRAEAAAAAECPGVRSSWQFFARMDSLVKGAPNCSTRPRLDSNLNLLPKGETNLEVGGQLQCSTHRDVDGSNSMPMDLNAENVNNNGEKKESKGTERDESADSTAKRRKGTCYEVAESIRLLARSILKIEETRMEMYKDSERMRAKAEIKKSEMELKRTEIVAQTQLQIAKLFVKRSREKRGKDGSFSIGDGVDAQPRPEGMGD